MWSKVATPILHSTQSITFEECISFTVKNAENPTCTSAMRTDKGLAGRLPVSDEPKSLSRSYLDEDTRARLHHK